MAEKTPVLKRIPLAAIRENPSALRSVNRQNPDYINLVDSVKNRGVLNPILVREIKSEDGKPLYGLIDGLHRYTSSLDAGHQDIPAQVINMDDVASMEAQLIGNVHKIETKPVEYSKQLQKILSLNPTLTMSQLAGKLNKSLSWLNERLGLVKLTGAIGDLVNQGKINLTNAYMLAKLPEEEQHHFMDRAMTMTPAEFTPTVANRKKEIDAARRQGRDAKPQEFVPVANLQRLGDIKTELATPKVAKEVCTACKAKTAEEGFAAAIKWVLHLDPASVASAKEKDDVRKKELEAKRQKAAAERAQKKQQDATTEAAKVGA